MSFCDCEILKIQHLRSLSKKSCYLVAVISLRNNHVLATVLKFWCSYHWLLGFITKITMSLFLSNWRMCNKIRVVFWDSVAFNSGFIFITLVNQSKHFISLRMYVNYQLVISIVIYELVICSFVCYLLYQCHCNLVPSRLKE